MISELMVTIKYPSENPYDGLLNYIKMRIFNWEGYLNQEVNKNRKLAIEERLDELRDVKEFLEQPLKQLSEGK